MSIASFIVVYVIAFWLVFFMVLPIGVRQNEEPEEGHDPGAPKSHMIGKKMLWAGIAAIALTGIYWYLADIVGIQLLPS
ncbi:MAG: DUF1467 family protein [Alphaproteobacteria bacterium]|jgi:predicted secreted protein|uniref:DUF1467 family protein n=1 Tax=Pacificispira sp. TaxID=2888761 RepID=UPI001B2F072F|nr:DUF1467 family protein [Alphaproteobacteria bacterium]MBO6862181.1 DUF1467 family protein [Alphaproteobacteria bacterium]